MDGEAALDVTGGEAELAIKMVQSNALCQHVIALDVTAMIKQQLLKIGRDLKERHWQCCNVFDRTAGDAAGGNHNVAGGVMTGTDDTACCLEDLTVRGQRHE